MERLYKTMEFIVKCRYEYNDTFHGTYLRCRLYGVEILSWQIQQCYHKNINFVKYLSLYFFTEKWEKQRIHQNGWLL